MKTSPLFSRIITLLLLSTAPIAAAESPNPPLDVKDLLVEGIRNNPEIRYYESEILAARAVTRTAGRLENPEISGSLGQKRSSDVVGQRIGDGTAWTVALTQSIEWPGRLGLRRAIANRDIQLAELGLERFKVSVQNRIRSRAIALAGAREKTTVLDQVADRCHALREVLVQRDPAGIAPELEIRILDATELGLRRKAAVARQQATESALDLLHVLGRPATNAVEVTPGGFQPPSLPPTEHLLAAAQTNNFDIRIRVAELVQQGFRVQLAHNERWPAFKVGPQFSEENAGGQDRILGVGVSFPLPLWRRNSGNVQAARARQAQAETALTTTRREVERGVVSAVHTVEAGLSELQRWRPDSVEHFAEAATLADRHYRQAAIPATLYLEIQKQYVEAIESILDARQELLEAAATLEELTGTRLLP